MGNGIRILPPVSSSFILPQKMKNKKLVTLQVYVSPTCDCLIIHFLSPESSLRNVECLVAIVRAKRRNFFNQNHYTLSIGGYVVSLNFDDGAAQ